MNHGVIIRVYYPKNGTTVISAYVDVLINNIRSTPKPAEL